MALIQKALADVRELQNEEIDLVGGAWSAEVTRGFTSSNVGSYCSPTGCYTLSVPDDVNLDLSTD